MKHARGAGRRGVGAIFLNIRHSDYIPRPSHGPQRTVVCAWSPCFGADRRTPCTPSNETRLATHAAGVVGTLLHPRELPFGLPPEQALGRPQHDGHPADDHLLLHDDLPAAGVPDVDVDGRAVGAVAEAALEGRGLGRGEGVLVDGGLAHPAVGVPQVEFGIVVGADFAGGGRLRAARRRGRGERGRRRIRNVRRRPQGHVTSNVARRRVTERSPARSASSRRSRSDRTSRCAASSIPAA